MKNLLKNASCILFVTVFFCACATARISSWEAPKGISMNQVFDAALKAGANAGLKVGESNRESGMISFARQLPTGELILNVEVKDENGVIYVKTESDFGGEISSSDPRDPVINNFHEFLFGILRITKTSDKNVVIDPVK